MSILDDKLRGKFGQGLSANDFSNKHKSLVENIERLNPFEIQIANFFYYLGNGTITGNSSRCYAIIVNDTATTQHFITTTIGGEAMFAVIFFNNDNSVIGRLFQGRNGYTDPLVNQQIIPPQSCAYYVVNGLINFGGIILRKKQNMFDYLQNILSEFLIQTPTLAENDKYYFANGTIQNNSNRKYAIYNIANTDNLRVSTVIGGSAMPAIVYLNASNQAVGWERVVPDGVVDYVSNFMLTIPSTATKMILNCLKVNNYSVYKIGTFTKAVSIQQLEVERQRITNIENQLKILLGLTVLHLGTSIPEGSLYPTVGPARLGGTGINLAVGSSMMRISRQDGTIDGLAWENVAYSLMHTDSEKRNMISNWANLNLANKPVSLTQAQIDKIISCSFENKVLPYLDGRLPEPNYWAIDHGRNDNLSSDTDAQFLANPVVRNDRRTYIGAMNYLIDLILSYKPYAKIFIVGHYENTLFRRVTIAQQSIADRYNIPILDMWNYTGFSQEKILGSNAKWNQSPWNLYIPSGQNLNEDMTRLRYYCPDGIHPFTDTSGKTLTRLCDIYTKLLSQKIV